MFDANGDGRGSELIGAVDGGDFAEIEPGDGFVIAGRIAAELVVELEMATESLKRFFERECAEVGDSDSQVGAVRPVLEGEGACFELGYEREDVLILVQGRLDLVDFTPRCSVVRSDRAEVEFWSAQGGSRSGVGGYGWNSHESPVFEALPQELVALGRDEPEAAAPETARLGASLFELGMQRERRAERRLPQRGRIKREGVVKFHKRSDSKR